jgi:hypothetical protein
VRLATAADDGILAGHRVLVCDRDGKWSGAVRRRFGEASLRVVVTPERAPTANAYAESLHRIYLDPDHLLWSSANPSSASSARSVTLMMFEASNGQKALNRSEPLCRWLSRGEWGTVGYSFPEPAA